MPRTPPLPSGHDTHGSRQMDSRAMHTRHHSPCGNRNLLIALRLQAQNCKVYYASRSACSAFVREPHGASGDMNFVHIKNCGSRWYKNYFSYKRSSGTLAPFFLVSFSCATRKSTYLYKKSTRSSFSKENLIKSNFLSRIAVKFFQRFGKEARKRLRHAVRSACNLVRCVIGEVIIVPPALGIN